MNDLNEPMGADLVIDFDPEITEIVLRYRETQKAVDYLENDPKAESLKPEIREMLLDNINREMKHIHVVFDGIKQELDESEQPD